MIHNTSVFHGDVQLPVLVNALTRCNMHSLRKGGRSGGGDD